MPRANMPQYPEMQLDSEEQNTIQLHPLASERFDTEERAT